MVVTLSKTITFIPDFNGNAELPADEQIIVTLKNLSVAEKERIRNKIRPKVHYDKDGSVQGMDMELGADKDALLSGMVQRIDNLTVEDSAGKSTPITNIAQLRSAPMELHGLLDEIYQKCSSIMNETFDQKN